MSTKQLPARSASELDKRSILRRMLDFIFGYDFFISYAWSDGSAYATYGATIWVRERDNLDENLVSRRD